MKARTKLLALVILTGIVTIGFAQEPETSTSGAPAAVTDASTGTFPYYAEVTGDDVLIRTGPGKGFYDCGKFKKGDKIRIVGEQFGVWSKIIPPAGSFSWISMQYVNIDPEDPSYGIVSGDNVRVYAGADNVPPQYATSLQVKLNKGDRVRLLNEQLNDYYKITPPPGAYLWVSTQYTKKTAPPLVGPPRILMTPRTDETTGEVVAADVEGTTAESVTEPNETPIITLESYLDKYYALQKEIEAEKAKPMNEQDYTTIKESLLEIANNKDAGKAARYAQAVIKQIEGFELAIEVGKIVKLQNEQLQKTRERIDKARAARLLELEDRGRFAVIGKLDNFMTYGPGNYRILDESNKTVCIAIPGPQAAGKDFSGLVGKKVGLVGAIEPHQQTAGALVRFAQIVDLE